MNRTVDPGAIPTDQFYLVENGRIQGNEIVDRGGEVKAINDGLSDCLASIIDDEAPSERILVYNVGTTTLKYIDENDNISTISSSYTGLATNHRRYLYSYYSHLHLQDSNDYLSIVDLSDGSLTATALDFTEDDVHDYAVVDTELHVLTLDGSVYDWDGAVSSTGDDIGYTSLSSEETLRLRYAGGDLVAFERDSAFRYTGTPGTWTAVSYPVALEDFKPLDAIVWEGYIYICGYNTAAATDTGHILRYDPSTNAITTVNSPASATKISALAIFNNLLHYAWINSSGQIKIGRKSQSDIYTDTYKDISSQYASITSTIATRLISFNRRLWLGGYSGGTNKLIRSPELDAAGDWEAMESSSSIVGSDMCLHKVVPE